MSLRDIVNVQITRQTRAVSRVGFGTLLIVGEHAIFAERVRYYADIDALVDDGFAVGDEIYKAAAAALSQSPRPVRIGVGRKAAVGETWVEAMTAIRNYNDEWYGLVITSRVEADVLAVAGWVETQIKIFGTSSDDIGILDAGDVGDIVSQLQDLGYARTFAFYHDEVDQYVEAALFGKQLPKDPGTESWKFKTLAAVTADQLTESQALAALDKGANLYQSIGGVSITREGNMVEGEFIDIIHGVDWLQARMTERIYSRLVNLPKVPYTDGGIAVVESEIRGQLQDAQTVGFIAGDTLDEQDHVVPAFTITVPRAADVPANDKAERVLNGVSFNATLAGAIHAVNVNGVVSL
jgi:hypothetical protein